MIMIIMIIMIPFLGDRSFLLSRDSLARHSRTCPV